MRHAEAVWESSVSALTGEIPRGLPDHRTREARGYRAYVEAKRSALPALPVAANPLLREAALANLDLTRLRMDLERLRARRGPGARRAEERRLRSEIRKTRVQLLILERQLGTFAHSNGHTSPGLSPSELLAQELAEEDAGRDE